MSDKDHNRSTASSRPTKNIEAREKKFWSAHVIISTIGLGLWISYAGPIGILLLPVGIAVGLVLSLICLFIYPFIGHSIMDEMKGATWLRALTGSLPMLIAIPVASTIFTKIFGPMDAVILPGHKAGSVGATYFALTSAAYFLILAWPVREEAGSEGAKTE